MLDRIFDNNGVRLRLTYNAELHIYKGYFININHPPIYADNVNELLEIFDSIINKN